MATNLKINGDSRLANSSDKTGLPKSALSNKFELQFDQMVNSIQQTEIVGPGKPVENKVGDGSRLLNNELQSYIPRLNVQKKQLEENYHERILSLREYRQQILASNIANADTPRYKAKDFDIAKAIRTGQTSNNVELLYSSEVTNNIDGNTVNLDVERSKFMEDAILYEYEVDRVREEFRDMENLLKNLPY